MPDIDLSEVVVAVVVAKEVLVMVFDSIPKEGSNRDVLMLLVKRAVLAVVENLRDPTNRCANSGVELEAF